MLYYKNLCSKQAGSCFLVYYTTFVIRKMRVQNKREAAFRLFSYFCYTKKNEDYFLVYSVTFLTQKICVQNKQEAAF